MPKSSQRSKVPSPLLASAHDASTTVCPCSAALERSAGQRRGEGDAHREEPAVHHRRRGDRRRQRAAAGEHRERGELGRAGEDERGRRDRLDGPRSRPGAATHAEGHGQHEADDRVGDAEPHAPDERLPHRTQARWRDCGDDTVSRAGPGLGVRQGRDRRGTQIDGHPDRGRRRAQVRLDDAAAPRQAGRRGDGLVGGRGGVRAGGDPGPFPLGRRSTAGAGRRRTGPTTTPRSSTVLRIIEVTFATVGMIVWTTAWWCVAVREPATLPRRGVRRSR